MSMTTGQRTYELMPHPNLRALAGIAGLDEGGHQRILWGWNGRRDGRYGDGRAAGLDDSKLLWIPRATPTPDPGIADGY